MFNGIVPTSLPDSIKLTGRHALFPDRTGHLKLDLLEVADARETARRMAEHGVWVHAAGPTTIRTVFHPDISDTHEGSTSPDFESGAVDL